ncbi:DUF1294 domain-containing protein [Desulfoscipio gibsoniae]|uniref:Putative membrane protein n=1 Tax=Desulfoscipio gibsoniae DSM 7213 TaxID=767817 RepID=R4KKC5_9FIRM|nr:DUF1294 domain-containing protein [Desulfoscipio gibsoniae]AGL03104.1 putative membrane protein [Desulfoscipio gibsoniae DSM 7213]
MLTIYLLVINIMEFSLFGLDKHRARRRLHRIPKKTLFIVALAGGTAGALAGIYFWRHKTKHLKFTVGIPVIMLVQILLYIFYDGQI